MATQPTQQETSEQQQIEVIQPQALELIHRAEIDMQIATAKKYPRDLYRVKKRMMDFATLDEETAESCFYTLARGGKTIQGPGVRLAEIAVACYTNLRAASRVIDNNGRTVTCQGACHDLENNTLISVEVQRRITDKNGKTFNDDMQIVTGNAGNAIAFRNAVFKVIPGVLIKSVYEAAKKVAVGNASTLVAKRTKIITRLNSMQVDTPRILQKLGKSSVENIGLEELELLIGMGTAIKDGDSTVDELFPETQEQVAKRRIAELRAQSKGCAEGETKEQRDARLEAQMSEQEAEVRARSEQSKIDDSDIPDVISGGTYSAPTEGTATEKVLEARKRASRKPVKVVDELPALNDQVMTDDQYYYRPEGATADVLYTRTLTGWEPAKGKQ